MSVVAKEDDLPKLDKFELREEIGHGGMATVYRARDPRLGREVAVKIIHRHLRDNPEVASRFVAEARAAAKLKHRGIVEVYDVSGEDDREKYLVVELIRGCTLRKTLLENRELPAEVGACIVAELCDAVDHAHAAGIIHRDIKPENVLIELPGDRRKALQGSDADLEAKSGATPVGQRKDAEDGKSEPARTSDPTPSRSPKSGRPESEVVIKLTDFGIAKVLDSVGVTSTGQVLGSPAHMAPEQIEGGEIDPRTDVFALGVLLYECLVGHLPFEGKNPAQVLRRVIEGTFSPADLERPTVGGSFSKIVAAALATRAEDRPDTPHALAEELRKELRELGMTDERKEIADYFEDPDAYVAELPKRIVPRLVARGEASRKARRVQMAASDFNRAHALAPDDSTILKRITKLNSSAGRQRLLRRVAVLSAGALVLGGATYGIVRTVRIQSTHLNPTDSAKLANESDSPPVAIRPVNDQPPLRPLPILSANRIRALPSLIGKPTAEPNAALAPRDVTLGISPPGALLSIDGTPIENPLGKRISLTPGSHPIVLTPPAGSECCSPLSSRIQVEPAAKDDKSAQTFALTLPFKPSTMRLVGAPTGGSAMCGQYPLIPGSAVEVQMSALDKGLSCDFSPLSTPVKTHITLKAGAAVPVPWPTGG